MVVKLEKKPISIALHFNDLVPDSNLTKSHLTNIYSITIVKQNAKDERGSNELSSNTRLIF